MGEKTHISWCTSTANFITGCTKVSPGCANCYAETLSNRNLGHIGKWGPGAPRRLHGSAVTLALKLNRKPWVCDECGKGFAEKQAHFCANDEATFSADESRWHRRRIFSNSLGDWLDPEVPVEGLKMMLDTIRICTSVTWLLLTKRPELWDERMCAVREYCNRGDIAGDAAKVWAWVSDWIAGRKIPPNIWIGTSVEDQQRADERIPHLLSIPAVKHFLSCEPLLERVFLPPVCGLSMDRIKQMPCGAGIDWVIIGGESGPKARPCNVDWIRSLLRQCAAASVPCFIKQLGSYSCDLGDASDATDAKWRWSIKHPKGADPAEWPAGLRVMEVPE